jgi:hypothetical protein
MALNELQISNEERSKNLYLNSREHFEDFLIEHAEKIANFPFWTAKFHSEVRKAEESQAEIKRATAAFDAAYFQIRFCYDTLENFHYHRSLMELQFEDVKKREASLRQNPRLKKFIKDAVLPELNAADCE